MNLNNLDPVFQAALNPFLNQPASKTIDISKLIEKAENLAFDGRLDMAAEGEATVQIIELDNGRKYELAVKMKLLPE